ncbi:MAG TPA: NADH-quinone oxidoreductase subunit M [Ktedonobacterales bacterium]|nr:NADH-quinone oxidoreductase subunit M [Ktedonobacterales bacterium]
MVQFPLLSVIIFLPVVAGLISLLLPSGWAKPWALVWAIVDLILAIILVAQFDITQTGFQHTETITDWIPALGISYSVGVDGISVFLVLLTTLMTAVAVGASLWSIDTRVKEYMALMLLLETGVLGVFLSTNLFLFYVFWEVMLIPAYFLIGAWGGPRRVYAAIKFVLYTAVGSLLMLVGIISLGVIHQLNAGPNAGFTLDLTQIMNTSLTNTEGILIFLAFFAAFAVKVGLVPLHSWLPDAYAEAPTPVTIMLSSVMTKTAAYGFIRFCVGLLPGPTHTLVPLMEILAVISILYGAVQALVQTDFKRLIAYSSISHLGVVILGIFALNSQGLEGGVLQMVNHGITIGALFLIAGYLEARTGTRKLEDYGGQALRWPALAVVFLIAALSSLGLPGLNSFAGEFLALLGTFHANMVYGVLGTLVVIPAAWYLLRFFQSVMHGREPDRGPVVAAERKGLAVDLERHELLVLLPLLLLIFYIGFFPGQLTNAMQNSVNHLPGVQTTGAAPPAIVSHTQPSAQNSHAERHDVVLVFERGA